MSDNNTSAAVQLAKEMASTKGSDNIRTLSSGIRVRLMPVSTALMDEVASRVKDPEVPVWRNEDKGRDEPNPNDPKYVMAVNDANRLRGLAIMDAMVMFGVELVDGIPQDDQWLNKLKFMEKRGLISLEGYDFEDPLDKEFLFKRFIAVDTEALSAIGNLSALTQEDVERAEDAFQSTKARRTNP